MKSLALIPVVAIAAVLVACPSKPPIVPPDASDAAPVADATPLPVPVAPDGAQIDACGQAESNLLILKCKDSRGRLLGGPNEHGVPFAAVCRDDLAKGVDVHASCIANASTCAGVSSCSL